MPYRNIKTIDLSNGKTYNFGDVITDKEFEELDEESKKMFIENVFDEGDRGDRNEEGYLAFKIKNIPRPK